MEKKPYHIVVGAIVFAVLMWVSVNMTDVYTVVKYMPVVLENLKEGKALKYPVPKTVGVRFRGSGWALAGLYLSPDVRYFIDLSSAGPENFMITGRDLLEHVKLPVALQPLDVKPDTIILAVDDYREKRVPIQPKIVIEYREGYGVVGAVDVKPESVLIGGSQYLIGGIFSWPTAYKKFENVRAPIDIEIPLEESPAYSIQLFAQSVRLKVNVQPFAEKTFAGIPVAATGVPLNREVIFIPPKIDIIVRGGIDQLARLTDDDFQATVGYQNLVQDSSGTVAPHLSAPTGVRIISRLPEQFQFIIRKRL